MDDLAEQLPAGFAADRLGHDSNCLLWFDEAERHEWFGSPVSHEDPVARYVPGLTEKLRFGP
jgi:hypothetical protein